ncbi:hypothetical protein [Mycolicibacterium mageritense]|uniref:hypothetical protein n=1 Tax=Mycolicibacterium mageritense TaxID=53462 RepID=UPI001E2C4B8E|nr:hypothetical protein [Mycolicibacterium mageritense]MCC9181129.1 hypothetical protein [Mycolicibacterium mageritense]
MTHQADIAAILAAHQFHWGSGGTTCRGSGCDWRGGYRPAHERHVAELIDAALHPRIETAEQLDALPEKAIVVDCHGNPVSKVDGIWWYGSARASIVPPYGFPARVLYNPGAGR